MAIVEMILSLSLGVVFLVSAIPKLRHPRGFVVTVLTYEVLPVRLAPLVARLLPAIEMLLALLLLSGIACRLASLAVALLSGGFAMAVGINILRGRAIDCGCFGRRWQRQIGPLVVVQDLALVGASILVARYSQNWAGYAPWSPLAPGRLDLGLATALCLVIALATTSLLRTVGRKGRIGRSRSVKKVWTVEAKS